MLINDEPEYTAEERELLSQLIRGREVLLDRLLDDPTPENHAAWDAKVQEVIAIWNRYPPRVIAFKLMGGFPKC